MPKNRDKTDILEEKKRELETELEQIQFELDDSFHKVRSDVTDTLNPVRFIRSYPWAMIGASVLLGFLISGNRKKKSSSTKEKDDSSEGVFRPILFTELKKMAAKRAASIATGYLEDIFQARRSKSSSPSPNGRRSVKKD